MIKKIQNSLPTKEQIQIMFPNLKDKDLEFILYMSEQTGLNILRRQIWAIPRGGKISIETSIDGLRLIAERTGKYAPGKEPLYNYNDKERLIKATAFVKKMTEDGTWHEVAVSALFSEYNTNMGLWKSKPHVMLSKCAEAQALRRAFPDALSGLYSEDEMGKEENIETKEDLKNKINKNEEYITDDKVKHLNDLVKKIPEDNQIDELDKLTNYFNINEIKELKNTDFIGFNNELNKVVKKYKGK